MKVIAKQPIDERRLGFIIVTEGSSPLSSEE